MGQIFFASLRLGVFAFNSIHFNEWIRLNRSQIPSNPSLARRRRGAEKKLAKNKEFSDMAPQWPKEDLGKSKALAHKTVCPYLAEIQSGVSTVSGRR
jgi:hypothetical protein